MEALILVTFLLALVLFVAWVNAMPRNRRSPPAQPPSWPLASDAIWAENDTAPDHSNADPSWSHSSEDSPFERHFPASHHGDSEAADEPSPADVTAFQVEAVEDCSTWESSDSGAWCSDD